MHILMTGGTGLIGTATCAALYAAGHKLTILTRRARPATTEATYITSLGECAETVDVVINLAGAGLADKRWSSAYKGQIVSSRVDLTRELVAWMSELEQPPERLISASAFERLLSTRLNRKVTMVVVSPRNTRQGSDW